VAGHTGPPAKKSGDLPILSDTTSAIAPAGQAEEMSMESMLLAAPMGMSKEERDFDFSHNAPQTIRSWSLNEFRAFVSDPVGKQLFFLRERIGSPLDAC